MSTYEYRLRKNNSILTELQVRIYVESIRNEVLPQVLDPLLLDELGFDPILDSPAPVADELHTAVPDGAIFDGNHWVRSWKLVPKVTASNTEEQVQKEEEYLAAQLNAKRENMKTVVLERFKYELGLGHGYTFPDGITGTIQIRDNGRDHTNLTGIILDAMSWNASDKSEPFVCGFRDEENQTHMLTADQAIFMVRNANKTIKQVFAVKWAHDNAIAAWDGKTAYDVNRFWPSLNKETA